MEQPELLLLLMGSAYWCNYSETLFREISTKAGYKHNLQSGSFTPITYFTDMCICSPKTFIRMSVVVLTVIAKG